MTHSSPLSKGREERGSECSIPVLKNCMLLAAGGMICGDVCNFPLSSKKVAGHPMNIQWFC